MMHWFTIIALFLSSAVGAFSGDWVEGEVLVQMKPGKTWDAAKKESKNAKGAGSSLAHLERVQSFSALSKHCGAACLTARSNNKTSTAQLLAELAKHPAVARVAPNHIRTRTDIVLPSDPSFTLQWGLENPTIPAADIDWRSAWRLARPALAVPNITAIMDTGIDYRHPDLLPNLWQNPLEIADNNIDDDNNGYVDDVFGADASGDDETAPFNGIPDGDPMDAGLDMAHGTHVAGIAGARTGNRGITGVNFNTRLLTLKASPDGNSFTTTAVINALDYAIELKNRGEPIVVINMSFGGIDFNPIEASAFAAANDADIVITAAAGNESKNNDTTPTYPAGYNYPNIISVASTTSTDARSNFSNFGTNSVDLAAPGSAIFSTRPTHLVSLATAETTSSTFDGRGMFFSGLTDSNGITGTLVDCGLGYATNFPPAVAGNIALIARGDIFFSTKVGNATAAGATACVIYNNVDGDQLFNGRLIQPSGLNIPAIAVTQNEGTALLNLLGQNVTVRNVFNDNEGYEYSSGTSMAAPMVAGAVAFAADHFPNDTAAERVQRVLNAADVLPNLESVVNGGRRLNLRRIVDGDADAAGVIGNGDGLPDWWELETVGDLDTLSIDGDHDNDGLTDWQEFLVGSDPDDANSGAMIGIIPNLELTSPLPPFREYQIETANAIDQAWRPFNDLGVSSESGVLHAITNTIDRAFFRLSIPE